MAYVRQNTSIPVPKLHYYDPDPHNAVGARYMIMDVVPGPRLSFVWDDLPPESRRSLVSQTGKLEKQLLDTRFPAIGSLVDEHGVLGELCCQYGNPNPLLPEHRGPFSSSRDYLLAHARSSLQAYTDRAAAGADVAFCNYAIRWLGLATEGISALTLTDEDECFAFYNEFYMTHIHVSPSDPTQIIGMLDWEGSAVGPL
ncbi:unnamed protein product [Mycena citricolor]|uniref:Aminoglycoside phosphotransferase domain-containing protein n=1 Tax=Mycena citricolor TaxID=2018698 RepID=A0AAD2GX18_9AGAR|nr:unnamed protein product [Mycena citricolor]